MKETRDETDLNDYRMRILFLSLSLSPSQPSVLFISLLSLSLPIPPPSYSLITSLLLYPSIPELCKIGHRRLSVIVPSVLCRLNKQPCSETVLDSLGGDLAVNRTATFPVSTVEQHSYSYNYSFTLTAS